MVRKKCYLCGRSLVDSKAHGFADTHEDQWVIIGPECVKKLTEEGITVRGTNLKLYPLTPERYEYFIKKGLSVTR